MRKFLFTLGMLVSVSTAAEGQQFDVQLNSLDPKEWGPAVEIAVTSASLERRNIAPIPVRVEVRLRRKILLGCQFFYRVTNTSTSQTIEMKGFAVLDQQYEEKLKPGKSVEFLANTLDRRERTDPEGDAFCVGKEPAFKITEVSP